MPNVYQDNSRMTEHSVRWQHHPAAYFIVPLLSQWMSTFCNSDVTVVGTTSSCDLWYSDRCIVEGMELLLGRSIHGVSCKPRSCRHELSCTLPSEPYLWISKKAFDLVNYNLLLQKLLNKNVPHRLIKWFFSYLDNRSQRVRIGTDRSG